jgi:large subunit ribosomal protein L24e
MFSFLVEVMKEASEIKSKRYNQLITNKLKPGRQIQKANRLIRAKKQVHLLRAPVADTKEEGELLEIIEEEIETEDEEMEI